MQENIVSLCCDRPGVNLSEANELQRDLSQLMRLFYVLSRDMVAGLDITVLHGYILMGLQINGPMTMTELSDYTKLAASTVTRVVDKLVRARLTQRAYDERDRRVIYLQLTPAGEKRSTQFRTSQALFYQGLLSGLSAPERESVLAGLAILTGRLAQLTDQRHQTHEAMEDMLAIAEAALT